MEGFEFMNAMKGISPELLKDPGAQNQMKNFWNMLDEMAANNPDVI